MVIQQTQVVSHMERAATAYATPQVTRFGSIREMTSQASGGGGANPGKTGNAIENNPGGGGGDVWRP